MNNNSHFLPPFTERSISCSYWGVLSYPLSCLYNTLYEGSLKIYSNTSHDNRVLVSNTPHDNRVLVSNTSHDNRVLVSNTSHDNRVLVSNTSHDNRVLVSNTLKCFPALDGVRYIICWEIHIVKKVVIMVSSEGKNWSLRYREGGI